MRYMLLIYDREADWATHPPEKQKEIMAAYRAFTAGILRSGHYRAGDQLTPVELATTVRVRDGKTVATDGPFAETREQLGGYYVVEAKNLDEALALAARIPSASMGSIEVRPLVESPGA
jgi:hypothetical protein